MVKTIGDLLNGITLPSEGLSILKKLPYNGSIFIELSKHIPTNPAHSHVVSIPYEVFSMFELNLNLVSDISELTCYFDSVSKSSRKYLEILARLERHNEVRDNVMMSTQSSIDDKLQVVADKVMLSLRLINEIGNLLERMNAIFDTTDHYIHMLGVSKSIPAARDKDGKLIFEFNNG